MNPSVPLRMALTSDAKRAVLVACAAAEHENATELYLRGMAEAATPSEAIAITNKTTETLEAIERRYMGKTL